MVDQWPVGDTDRKKDTSDGLQSQLLSYSLAYSPSLPSCSTPYSTHGTQHLCAVQYAWQNPLAVHKKLVGGAASPMEPIRT